MSRMTTTESPEVRAINDRGHAGGWQAELLAAKAQQLGVPMAVLWRQHVARSIAFSVPARCVGVSARRISYEFSDGSLDSYERPEENRK